MVMEPPPCSGRPRAYERAWRCLSVSLFPPTLTSVNWWQARHCRLGVAQLTHLLDEIILRSLGDGEHGVYGVGVREGVTPRPCRRQNSGWGSGVTSGTDTRLCCGYVIKTSSPKEGGSSSQRASVPTARTAFRNSICTPDKTSVNCTDSEPISVNYSETERHFLTRKWTESQQVRGGWSSQHASAPTSRPACHNST